MKVDNKGMIQVIADQHHIKTMLELLMKSKDLRSHDSPANTVSGPTKQVVPRATRREEMDQDISRKFHQKYYP